MKKPANSRHALFIGSVVGMAMRHGVILNPIADEDGDWTDTLLVKFPADQLPEGVTLTVVVPEPPDDWTLTS